MENMWFGENTQKMFRKNIKNVESKGKNVQKVDKLRSKMVKHKQIRKFTKIIRGEKSFEIS